MLSVAPHGLVSAWIDTTGCGGDSTEIAAGAPGGPVLVIETVTGDFSRPYGSDPCQVGGSDLPYSEMTIAARIVSGPHSGLAGSAGLRISPDGPPPTVTVEATPPSRSQVFPGDTILLVVRVDDGLSPGLGQTGVRDVEVSQADGTILHAQQFGTEPVPCDKARLHQEFALTVTVPANAEDIFWVDVAAGDFAGNSTRVALAWPTTTTWVGTMDGDARAVSTAGVGAPNNCTARWLLLIEIPVEARGDVRGRAEVQAQNPPQCVPWGFAGEGRDSHFMTVTGTFRRQRVRAQFPFTDTSRWV